MIQIMKITFRIWLCLVLLIIIGTSVNYLIPMAININNDKLACIIISIIVPLATVFVCGVAYYTTIWIIRDIGKALK